VTQQISAVEPPLLKVNGNWDYLLELKLYTLTEERILELEAKVASMCIELETLKATGISTLWVSELKRLDF